MTLGLIKQHRVCMKTQNDTLLNASCLLCILCFGLYILTEFKREGCVCVVKETRKESCVSRVVPT